MIEGDISLRGMHTSKQQLVAVMAQPPATDSDITFEEWFDQVVDSGKGMKLDFMHIEAVELALQKFRGKEVKDLCMKLCLFSLIMSLCCF